MGIIQRIFNKSPSKTCLKLVTERGNGYYAWDGKIYYSDIVRSCMRPKVKAVGKLVGKHIRETVEKGEKRIDTNPDLYIKFLLEEPNPLMTGQKFQEKLAAQLILNSNAFALIIRDERGLPYEIYPVPAVSAEAVYGEDGSLSLKFVLKNGNMMTAPYTNIIHLREDYNDNDVFGESIAPALTPLMNIVTTTDQGIIKAIKNSNIVQWLLRYTTPQRPEDLEESAKKFASNYLNIESAGTVGVAAVDSKAEAQQVTPNDYVPNASQMDRTTKRIYALFNTNEKIVTSCWGEDEWTAYFESEIEPVQIQLSNEYTRKMFNRRQRVVGDSIFFEAYNLQYASMSTKLALQAMVDRGAMTPNEWRQVFNLSPIDGGDQAIRRLDTAVVNQIKNLTHKLGGENDKEIIETINRLIEGR